MKLKRSAISSIRMGQMSVASDGQQLHTLLGSCVGIALIDGRNGIGGLAHVVLPRASGPTELPGKFVDTAIPTLIKEIAKLANGHSQLVAKLAGGASMFATTAAGNIGKQNVHACESLLRELGIPLKAKHCGGQKGRRMTLFSDTGQVTIEIIGEHAIEI